MLSLNLQKSIINLYAFFTLIVKPDTSTWLEAGFGMEIAMIHMIWFSSLAYILTHMHVKKHLERAQYYIVKIMGALLVAFGVRIATLKQVLALPAEVVG
jgi:threonine/homoserine/homoserine lactone efflux protein